jgi:hypothetical protein
LHVLIGPFARGELGGVAVVRQYLPILDGRHEVHDFDAVRGMSEGQREYEDLHPEYVRGTRDDVDARARQGALLGAASRGVR